MKIILCGYNWIGCNVLEQLLVNKHEVFVFTHENPYYIPSLIDECKRKGISYSCEDISKSKLPFKPDIICSIYYRYLIKPHIIQGCNGKIFNLHPALLPKYRGCSSITWALINGEKETGYSYHYIDEQCDTGNIILQKSIPIESYDTQQSLYNRVMFEASKDFLKVLTMVKDGKVGHAQQGISSYYKRGCPYQGEINPQWSDAQVERFIRAMYNPPYPYASYKGQEVKSMQEYLKLKTRG